MGWLTARRTTETRSPNQRAGSLPIHGGGRMPSSSRRRRRQHQSTPSARAGAKGRGLTDKARLATTQRSSEAFREPAWSPLPDRDQGDSARQLQGMKANPGQGVAGSDERSRRATEQPTRRPMTPRPHPSTVTGATQGFAYPTRLDDLPPRLCTTRESERSLVLRHPPLPSHGSCSLRQACTRWR